MTPTLACGGYQQVARRRIAKCEQRIEGSRFRDRPVIGPADLRYRLWEAKAPKRLRLAEGQARRHNHGAEQCPESAGRAAAACTLRRRSRPANWGSRRWTPGTLLRGAYEAGSVDGQARCRTLAANRRNTGEARRPA